MRELSWPPLSLLLCWNYLLFCLSYVELSIILFVLCGPLQIAVALILAIFLSTFVCCLTFISIFCGMCTGK